MNILFITPEAVPFAKSGGLGDVAGSLPAALNGKGADVRVMMPLYKDIKEKYGSQLEYLTCFTCPLSWRRQYCGIFRGNHGGVTYYFLDNEQYFYREGYYCHYDDGERFAFFSRAALESLRYLEFKPQILHCSEWQSALVPVFLKAFYQQDESFRSLRTVFTIHNIEYQGRYGMELGRDVLGLPEWSRSLLEWKGGLNFMKGAVGACDRLTTVSPSYAEEITYPFFAHGLEDIIRENQYKLSGILNGIDQGVFDPSADPSLHEPYSKKNPAGKMANKLALQRELGLEENGDIPLIGMVGRMAEHKGLSLVQWIFDELMREPIQFVILGSGEKGFEDFFRSKAFSYRGRMSAWIGFSGPVASRIYAGSDLFLMPSTSEPCGLAQMIALRYGTPPIVRETGGLRDTVSPFDPVTGQGNGITFCSVNAHDMLGAIRRGLGFYYDKSLWSKLQANAFKSDFSWTASAEKYMEMYRGLLC
ncbi:MAG: glycogen synthase GlgA [Clostridiales bacterium]|nr:glycogen synthase GlgA [Clostridiales bacterium]